MRFGIRVPSLKKSLIARTSLKRMLRQKLKLKAPKGGGFVTNPKRAVYNRVYKKSSISLFSLLKKVFR